MLKITSDGRKLGLDQRIINPMLPDEPGSKVNQCVENILRIWREGSADKLTQLVFCDISTPKEDGSFTVYDDICQKLIDGGLPKARLRTSIRPIPKPKRRSCSPKCVPVRYGC